MDTGSAENWVLEEGKSSELAAILGLIQETTVDDIEKYSAKTCRELARIIVCRTYASAVHELCHLAVAAAQCDPSGRYENLFWNSGTARAGAFRGYFAKCPETGAVAVSPSQIDITYADKPFSVTYGRMPLLSALMEFLMTALGYSPLDDALAPLLGDLPTAKQVSEAANGLSRNVYAYLGEHLPPVQTQRRNRGFLAFVAESAGDGPARDAIDDDLVLHYWLNHSGDDGGDGDTDTRTFRGVFQTAARLIQVLLLAGDRFNMENAAAIGTDWEAGEVDPSDLEAVLTEVDEEASPLDALTMDPASGIKFLNGREMDRLSETAHGEAVATQLPRSILRGAVFGDAQARLTQALRGKGGASKIIELLENLPDTDYTARLEAYEGLGAHMEKMLLIAFHVLSAAGDRRAIPLALALRPDLDLGDLSELGDEPEWTDSNVISLQGDRLARQFLERVRSGTGAPGQMAKDAATAFKSVARQGFSEDDINRDEIQEGFAEGAEALLMLRRELSRFLHRHASAIDWRQQFDTDRPQFQHHFTLLYGGRDA